MKSRAFRVVRNVVISIVVLLAVLVGGGFAYTYYFGPDGTQSAATEKPAAPAAAPDLKPRKPSPNAPVSASVQTITSPVAPGSNSSITVKTTPGAACKISVVYKDVASADSGLAPKAADEYGVVSWTWTVGAAVPLGTWPVKVTCAHNAKSAMVQADLVVAKQQ